MRICFVTYGDLNGYRGELRADVLCFPFHALGEVSFERELKGETSMFEDVALLSKQQKSVVLCGCYTSSGGMRRKSVVVAERGRILGVSDMVTRIDKSEYRCGAGVKVYETQAGKIGVIVAEDLYFPKTAEVISSCGADVAVCVFEELNESLESTLARASGFFYGVPVCLCACGYAMAANAEGKLDFASPQSPVCYRLEKEREFHIVETRKSMILRRKKGY